MEKKSKISSLPKCMAERALFARQQFIKKPQNSQIDDDNLVWCFNEEDGLWYSILGNYSQFSPEEKRLKESVYLLTKEELEKLTEIRAKERESEILYWSSIRAIIIKRDKNKCQICKKIADSKLHVHHILKRSDGGEDYLDNLILVCPKCHKQADGKLYSPKWKEVI